MEAAVNGVPDETLEEVEPTLPENFSDLDDEEINACLCTEQEAQTKKAIWDHTHRYYILLSFH